MHTSLSAVEGSEWFASRSFNFTSKKAVLGTEWTEGYMCPKENINK
jgi:hypothetical protein